MPEIHELRLSSCGALAPPCGHFLYASVHVAHLQDVVQGKVPEGFAAEDESLRGLLRLVDLVPGGLGVLHLSQLHVLSHAIKLLLGILELAHVTFGGNMAHLSRWRRRVSFSLGVTHSFLYR